MDEDSELAYEPDDPREWLRMAHEDLLLAQVNVDGVRFELRAFHVQQAAEKALRAVCIARGVEFPYTHDIGELLDTLASDGMDVALLRRSKVLTRFAVITRYPPRGRSMSTRRFAGSLKLARRVLEWSERHASRGPALVKETRASRYVHHPSDGRAPDESLLNEVVRRIVRVARPERIILFGSGARGTMGPHSDLDLLIVAEDTDDEGELEYSIREALSGLRTSFDLIMATPADLARYGSSIALVYRPALQEGRVLYSRNLADTGLPVR